MNLSLLTSALIAMFFTKTIAIPRITHISDVAISDRSISDTFGCPVQEASDGQLYVLPCNGKVAEKRGLPNDFTVYPDGTGHYLGRSLTSDQVSRVIAGVPNDLGLQKRQNWIAGLICLGDLYDCEAVSWFTLLLATSQH